MGSKTNGKTVLLVEDEQFMREALESWMEKEGFAVLSAKDGKQGLSLALKKKPDIILLDILMPKMDGITLLKHLRSDTWGKTAAVFMLTNIGDEAMIDQANKLGAKGYMLKAEWSLKEISDKVKQILKI